MDLQIRKTKGTIENIETTQLATTDADEANFWENLIHVTLKPTKIQLTQMEELKTNLRALRNTTLTVIFVINLTWSIVFYTLSSPQFNLYVYLPARGFSLLLLAVYTVSLIVEFVGLICHRAVMLVHYLSRVKSYDFTEARRNDAILVSLNNSRD